VIKDLDLGPKNCFLVFDELNPTRLGIDKIA
jgi:hypothetical protein